jgi:hypothetical protein
MAWFTNTWAGLGYEAASEMGIGISRHTGLMISVGDLMAGNHVRWLSFQQNSSTLGLGLGGAVGLNFVIGLNAARPMDFQYEDAASGSHGMPSFDFSLDMGQGGIGKFAGLGKYFYSIPETIELIGIAKKFDRNIMGIANALKNYEKNIYNIKAVAENILKNAGGLIDAYNKKPAMISLPLPGSLGVRFSVKMKFETTDVFPQGSL